MLTVTLCGIPMRMIITDQEHLLDSHSTMYRRIKLLEEKGRIASCSDLNKTSIPDSLGVSHETTIYNLNVLNQLAMICIESDVLNETSKKFSDILSEVETTGSYSIRKPDSYMIEDKIERAKRWIEETEEWQKALSAEETAHAETTQTNTIQNSDLIFGQKHNDIDCALCPTAKRACDRAWVTAKNLEEWSEMSTTTLWRWLEKLEKARRIATFSDMKKWLSSILPVFHTCVERQVSKILLDFQSTEPSKKKSRFELLRIP